MYPPDARPRQEPLVRCPDLACRRAGRCLAEDKSALCRKLYMTIDEARDRLAERLEALYAEWKSNPANANFKPKGSYDDRLRELKEALEEREKEFDSEPRRRLPAKINPKTPIRP
jgi:hypothetical protein